MGCAKWRKRFNALWWNTDDRPRGRDKQCIEKQNRQEAKKEIKEELEYLNVGVVEDYDKEHEIYHKDEYHNEIHQRNMDSLQLESESVFEKAERAFKESEGDE